MKKLLLAIAFISLIPITDATLILFDNIGNTPETSFQNFTSYVAGEIERIEVSDETQYELTPGQYLEQQENMIPDDLSEIDRDSAEVLVHSLKNKYESYWNNVN